MKSSQTWKTMITAVLIMALIIPFTVFADDAAPPANIAQVNGKKISYKAFERQLEMFKQQVTRGQTGQFPEELLERAKKQVVEQMVAEELLLQQSAKKGFKLEAGYVENELKTLKGRLADDHQYQEILKRMQMTEDQLKDHIAHQGTIQKFVEKEVTSKIKISKDDAQKYYKTNKDKFHQPERVRAQHILIKVETGDDDKKKTEARKKLEGLKKRILAGEDFGKLAKENSEGPSNVREGDLGYFTKGRMVKSFEDVAFKLASNEVSDIVETQFGYHLIKVLDHQADKALSFEEVEPRIMVTLRNEMVQKEMAPYLEKLKEKAKIEIFLK